jgi:hypothetical protein
MAAQMVDAIAATDLHFEQKASRLPPLGDTQYVERVEKAPEENAQAQVQEAAPAPKIPSP